MDGSTFENTQSRNFLAVSNFDAKTSSDPSARRGSFFGSFLIYFFLKPGLYHDNQGFEQCLYLGTIYLTCCQYMKSIQFPIHR